MVGRVVGRWSQTQTILLQGNLEGWEVIEVGWSTSIFGFLVVASGVDMLDGVCEDKQ